MAAIRMRYTGTDDGAWALIDLLKGFPGVDDVFESEDLQVSPYADEQTGGGLAENVGPDAMVIEVQVADDDNVCDNVVEAARTAAMHRGAVLEIIDDDE